jgi:hypothetical protein
VEGYWEQAGTPGKMSYRKFTKQFNEKYFEETGKVANLNWMAIYKHFNGLVGKTLLEMRCEQGLLTLAQDDVLREFLYKCAEYGFPCTPQRVSEAANILI